MPRINSSAGYERRGGNMRNCAGNKSSEIHQKEVARIALTLESSNSLVAFAAREFIRLGPRELFLNPSSRGLW